uniref:CDK5RAP1-like protein n=1 Tax=Clastoptera arizonana TaxID=38151 RepID=A0A1B6CD53_9HEMI
MNNCLRHLRYNVTLFRGYDFLYSSINQSSLKTRTSFKQYSQKVYFEDDSKEKMRNIKDGPGLKDFFKKRVSPVIDKEPSTAPYLDSYDLQGWNRKVFFDIYGCQMNVNDMEIVWAILKSAGFEKTDTPYDANVILMMTCAIRENPENRVFKKLAIYKSIKKKRGKKQDLKIGILGCMAERLKHKLIEMEKSVDLIAGPDSYKDLPRLLALTSTNQVAVNVMLSLDETYADITPVRMNEDSVTAYVSIMRGCDNMCTYCIVPFTRGRERSRPIDSIIRDIKLLSEKGVKEVTLLGQNVNSYRDTSCEDVSLDNVTQLAKGFNTVYKVKKGGLRFSDLLDKVSLVDPNMRIRFTSPHPKDFPDEVLQIISERNNICHSIHLPAQSGNTAVLKRMRRGYSREAYLELIHHVREVLPDVTLSSDFICGFCDETEEEFNDTLTLLDEVKYDTAFLFAYSMREKTTAYRKYTDNVPADVKQERLLKMIKIFRHHAEKSHQALVGTLQLVLLEGKSKRSSEDWFGRNDGNIKVIVPNAEIPFDESGPVEPMKAGDYVVVQILSSNSQILKGVPLYRTTLQKFYSDVKESKVNIQQSV